MVRDTDSDSQEPQIIQVDFSLPPPGAVPGERVNVTDEELVADMADMFDQNPGLRSVGVAKVREALLKHRKIRVNVKRLRPLLREYTAQHSSSAPEDESRFDGPGHNLHDLFWPADEIIHTIQRIWNTAPEGRNMPLPEFRAALRRETERPWTAKQARAVGDLIRAEMEAIARPQLPPDNTKMEDLQIELLRNSKYGSWCAIAVRKDVDRWFMFDETSGIEYMVMPEAKTIMETSRRFTKDSATRSWWINMPETPDLSLNIRILQLLA